MLDYIYYCLYCFAMRMNSKQDSAAHAVAIVFIPLVPTVLAELGYFVVVLAKKGIPSPFSKEIVVAILVFLIICSFIYYGPMGNGERIKDRFAASKNEKSCSITGGIIAGTLAMPLLLGLYFACFPTR